MSPARQRWLDCWRIPDAWHSSNARRTRYKCKLVVGCIQANHKLQSISLLCKCTMLPCEGPRISGCNTRNIPVSSLQGVQEEGEAGGLGGSGVGRLEGAR